MSCTCHNHNTMATSDAKAKHPERPSPTSQCLFCAQKHADEAFVAMNEHSYELENRSFIHGSIPSSLPAARTSRQVPASSSATAPSWGRSSTCCRLAHLS